MNLKEAIQFLTEIVDNCPQVNGKNFVIMLPSLPNSAAEGYEIAIRKESGSIDKSLEEHLREAAAKKTFSNYWTGVHSNLYACKKASAKRCIC